MGIRVDAETLDRQLTLAGCDGRRALPFHKALLAGELPLTIGGGIGQSRLCMLLLGKAHIGEVQVSLWDEETVAACRAGGIQLLCGIRPAAAGPGPYSACRGNQPLRDRPADWPQAPHSPLGCRTYVP